MKRNMDLVRQILLNMEENEHGNAPSDFAIEGYTEEQVGYHCYLLNEAGLIKATVVTANELKSPFAVPINLRWDGHEFLNNAKNENVWSQAKEAVSKIGDASFSVWASVLSQVVSKNLGL